MSTLWSVVRLTLLTTTCSMAAAFLQTSCSVDECVVDADCPEGAICDKRAECVQGCRVDDDCRSGTICTNDSCVQGCRTDSECEPEGYCSSISDRCKVCSPGLFKCSCGANNECSGELTCQGDVCLYPSLLCGDGVCSTGESCSADCDTECGDGVCDAQESCDACPEDCGPCPEGLTCDDLIPLTWSGIAPCMALNPYEQYLLGDLQSVWRSGPAVLCSYDGQAAPIGPCGPLVANNALYCTADDSIAWDVNFMNAQVFQHGDFAAVAIVAHEWGHRNQALVGLLTGVSNKALELHADCQAGVYAAVAEARGLLDMGDPCEAFASLCAQGDPVATPWFQVGAHGTCQERVAAFDHGYLTARAKSDALCGDDPIAEMRKICG